MDINEEVWVKNKDIKDGNRLWNSARIVSKTAVDNTTFQYVAADSNGVQISFQLKDGVAETDDVKKRNDQISSNLENLIDLTYLNEPELLRYLEERFMKSLIYSYTGPVLIALNPSNVVVPDESSERLFSQFMKKIVVESQPESLTPQGNASRNTIIINGESGSGKTECTRLFLKSLLDANKGEDPEAVEQQEEMLLTLLSCGGILEAFGNAQLEHSSNSSRFGRYINLQLDRRGLLIGGEIKSYLLESIRVVNQQRGEQNFHIFHRLLQGASQEERVALQLDAVADCQYLPQHTLQTAENNNNNNNDIDLRSLQEALFSLGVSVTEVEALLQAVAAVLHIGKIHFESFFENAVEGAAVSEGSQTSVAAAARLLQLSEEDLKRALTTRSVISARETFQARLKVGQAQHVRDSVAKSVYKKAFDWLTTRLNCVLQQHRQQQSGALATVSVGVLDVFGFDAFDSNGLEQLCINYANETLQQLFNQHMFKFEMLEYEREHIPFQSVEYPDNQRSIDLVQNLFKILDDQCRLPNATDKRFSQVLTKELNNNNGNLFLCSQAQAVANKFSIVHFAGPVQYSADGFIEKNTDEMPQEAVQLLRQAGNVVLCLANNNNGVLDTSEDASAETAAAAAAAASVGDKSPMRVSRRASNTRSAPSAVTQFQNELKLLLKDIGATQQHFVRCINPSGKKRFINGNNHNGFVQREVADQLRYGGILSAMLISRSGYSGRFTLEDFYARYRHLVSPSQLTLRHSQDTRQQCQELVRVLGDDTALRHRRLNVTALDTYRETHQEPLCIDVSHVPVGVSKVFLKKKEKNALEWLRRVVVLQSSQRIFRFIFHRRTPRGLRVQEYLKRLVVLQCNVRMFVARRKFQRYLQHKQQQEQRATRVSAVQLEVFSPIVKPTTSTSASGGLIKKRSSFFGEVSAVNNEVEVSSSGAEVPADIALASKVAKQARERKNTAAKVGEYKKLDEKLLKEINALIAAKRISDETALLRFDIPRARALLLQWATNYVENNEIHAAVTEVAGLMDSGFNLLLPEKLVPLTMLGKMISLGRSVKPENRSTTAAYANKNVTKDHKMFKQIMILMEKIKDLIEKLQTLRKAMESVSKSRENYNSPLMICYKTIDFLRILHQYYYQYVIRFVEEYGDGSEYKKQFLADENRYVRELAALVSLKQPLLRVEKQQQLQLQLNGGGVEGDAGGGKEGGVSSSSSSGGMTPYGVFPITLSVEALNQAAAEQANNNNNNINNNNNNINNNSTSLSEDRVVFRLIHCAPGLEYASNCLFMMLQQEVVMYPIRFIKLVGKSALNYGQIAFYQAANDFTGETLADLATHPGLLDTLDTRSYSTAFLCSLLSGALSAQPRNYMVKTVKDSAGHVCRASILGVVNDADFCTQLFHPQSYDTSEEVQGHNNVLFTCAQLTQPLDTEVRDTLLSHPAVAAEIVSSWIRELYRQNVRYNGLIESGFTESDLQRLMVPISLPRHAAVQVYHTLSRVIDCLRLNPAATHGDLLAVLHPALARRYGVLVQELRPLSREQRSERLLSTKLFSCALQDLKPPNEQFTIDRVQLDGFATTVEDAAIEFLKRVDFSSFTDDKSLTSCAQIGDNLSFLSALWLRNVTEEQLAVMFGVVIHMAYKTRKQKKENFGAKLFTKAIFLTGLDEEETRTIQESVIFNRIQDLLGMHVYFEDPAPTLKPKKLEDDEDYGHGIEDVKLEF